MDFENRKKAILKSIYENDKSVKQSIDAPALPIVNFVNSIQDYVTTSSCSGRVSIISLNKEEEDCDVDDKENKRRGGEWFYVSHAFVNEEEEASSIIFPNKRVIWDMNEPYYQQNELIYFKCEPFILHVEAADLSKAKQLLTCALQAGYRNSGMVISSSRFIVAVRHTMKLDIPIGHVDKITRNVILCISPEYLQSLIKLSNKKLEENFDRMKILLTKLENTLIKVPVETKEERRIRKRAEGLMKQQEKKNL